MPLEPIPEPTTRVALVVGNGAYRTIPALANPVNDAEDMCAALRRLGFEVSCHLNLSTRADFRRVLQEFGGRLSTTSAAFFYYAGHGVQVKGRNFLLPTFVAPSTGAELEDEGVPLDDVFAVLKRGRTALNVVVLDACRDDPFGGRRGVRVATGLAREEPPPRSVLVYATAPGGAAADGKGRNGLFTTNLLAQIEKTGPQIGEMFHGVARMVEQQARQDYGVQQIPYRSFSYSGVFCFAGCDDTRIARELEALKAQSVTAARRIQELEAHAAALEGTGQSRATDAALRESADRAREIAALRAQIDDMANKSAQLEAYRQRIATLEAEARDKERRLTETARKSEAQRSRPTAVPTF